MTPEDIAREHVAWAIKDGQSPAQIILSVGGIMTGKRDLNGKDAEKAVADAWVRLWATKNRKRMRAA